MGIKSVEQLVFGVDDMESAARFWRDFGLAEAAGESGEQLFSAANGSSVVVRRADDPALPPAVIAGPTARQVIWGVESADDLATLAADLATDREVTEDADGTIRTTDPVGYAIAFRVSTTSDVTATALDHNVPGQALRVDRPGKIYQNARPQYLSHVVFKVPDLAAALPFYRDRLGFKVTDCYPDQGYFLRGAASTDHHNLFLLNVGDEVGFHHVAFELGSIHELFGGGLNMGKQGWDTHLGPGRHPISSCYFWYFKNPCGGAAEYDWDSDHVTDAWVAREWERAPEVFAEWALEDGMQLYGGIQTGSV